MTHFGFGRTIWQPNILDEGDDQGSALNLNRGGWVGGSRVSAALSTMDPRAVAFTTSRYRAAHSRTVPLMVCPRVDARE